MDKKTSAKILKELQDCLQTLADHLNDATDAVDDVNGDFTESTFRQLMNTYQPLEEEDNKLSEILQRGLRHLPEDVSVEVHAFLAAYWAKFASLNVAMHILAIGLMSVMKHIETPLDATAN